MGAWKRILAKEVTELEDRFDIEDKEKSRVKSAS